MAKNKTEYDLLISCPGDVASVVKLVNAVVKKFNDTYSDILSIRINAKHWTNSSYNQSGGKAQDLLNNQFIHECDAAIAVFWTRFGSPTDKYGSGTEEEIEDMLAAGKQVFLYFCEKPIDPNLLLDDKARVQYQKVKDYQEKYSEEGKGIYAQYASDKEFKDKLFAHLSLHFLSQKKVEEISIQRKSVLNVKGIQDGKLYDSFFVGKFRPNGGRETSGWIEKIRSMYNDIAGSSVGKEETLNPLNGIGLTLQKNVELQNGTVTLISTMAEHLDIGLPSDFFSLGGLKEDSFSVPAIMGGSRNFYGTKAEKEKYRKLIRLYENIDDFLGWAPFYDAYCELLCVKLAVHNDGTKFDEDIDVSLRFRKSDLIKPNQLPVLGEHGCECILNDYSLFDLLGIPATQNYNDFESSKTANSNGFQPIQNLNPNAWMYQGRNYKKEYQDTLENAFEYAFFDDGEYLIVKLHIDYLKHNTAVAFPTVLFVSEQMSSIEYTIRSKQNEMETVGTIEVGGHNET